MEPSNYEREAFYLNALIFVTSFLVQSLYSGPYCSAHCASPSYTWPGSLKWLAFDIVRGESGLSSRQDEDVPLQSQTIVSFVKIHRLNQMACNVDTIIRGVGQGDGMNRVPFWWDCNGGKKRPCQPLSISACKDWLVYPRKLCISALLQGDHLKASFPPGTATAMMKRPSGQFGFEMLSWPAPSL